MSVNPNKTFRGNANEKDSDISDHEDNVRNSGKNTM